VHSPTLYREETAMAHSTRRGVSDEEVTDAHGRGTPLDVYPSARRAGLAHDDAVVLFEAGLRHAAGWRTWETAARANPTGAAIRRLPCHITADLGFSG
jgi:hypothetical protein